MLKIFVRVIIVICMVCYFTYRYAPCRGVFIAQLLNLSVCVHTLFSINDFGVRGYMCDFSTNAAPFYFIFSTLMS